MSSTPGPRGLRVLVAGGGIGGLAAAVALRQQGHEVEVFEKSKLLRELGAAVYCAPNCTAALRHVGVSPEDFGGVIYRGSKFLNPKGEVTKVKTVTEEESAKWLATWWLVSRIDLHNALRQKAVSPDGPGVPVKIHTGSAVDSVDCEAASISLSGGATVSGDLVVGADGIHSKTRRSVLGRDVPLSSTGRACYRWLIPTPLLADDPATRTFVDMPGHFVQVASSDRQITMYPCGSGDVINCAAVVPKGDVGEIKRGLTGYDQVANKEQLKSHFQTFSEPVLRVLDKAPEDNVKLWGMFDMELQPSVIKGKALLIGDAAQPFLPFMGQGAAQAIEDGCALGAVFPPGTPAEEVSERLELWQRCRKHRRDKIVEDTRDRGRNIDRTYGTPLSKESSDKAMQHCIDHDAWEHAEEQMRAWAEQKA